MSEETLTTLIEHQAKFSASGQVLEGGKFEILCITAGNGNGWEFPADVLKSSLSLWEGAHCFLDHAWFSRSVRDLAGQVNDPQWDEDAKGIRATLKAIGPGGELLATLGREILQDDPPPKVGFSADFLFTANGKKVREIKRVLSIDLVLNPARGGAFLRALNSLERPHSKSALRAAAPGVCPPHERWAKVAQVSRSSLGLRPLAPFRGSGLRPAAPPCGLRLVAQHPRWFSSSLVPPGLVSQGGQKPPDR